MGKTSSDKSFPSMAAGALIAFAAVAVGVGLVRKHDFHMRRCMDGLACVYTVRDDEGELLRVLNVGGAYQSATRLDDRWAEPAFEYYRAFDRMFEAEAEGRRNAEEVDGVPVADPVSSNVLQVRNVLMIGGGGCSYPKHLMTSRDRVCIDVVERDPAIARIARDFFFVDRLEREFGRDGEGRFSLLVDDGLGYLERGDSLYDVIIDDAFSGDAADDGLLSDSGLKAVTRRLRRGGLFLVNVVADDSLDDAMRLQGIIASLRRRSRYVHTIDASDERFGGKSNYLVVATDGSYAFSDVIPW